MLNGLGVDQDCDRQTDCCIVLKSGAYAKAIYVLISPFRSNRDRVLTANGEVVQVPVGNALVLGNLCEYRDKSYTAKN